MKRYLTFEEISDGKKYGITDYVNADCDGCVNCSECCKFTDDTIHLDPFDIFNLSKALNKGFNEMLDSPVNLTVVDGIITPFLMKKKDTGECVFLSNGRCEIHKFRPGFCRLFPLGRIYEDDGSFKYFIQVHECPYESKKPVRVSDWLSIDEPLKYEAFIRNWHFVIKTVSEDFKDEAEALKKANMNLLNIFFLQPYDLNASFYEQFDQRFNKWLGN